MKHPLIALFGALTVFAAVAIGVLGYVLPSGEAPRVEPGEPVTRPLTDKLALVIVDGLRWDVATDPERMPRFAEALRRHAGGELMAGRVSMTTSAILTMVTGERGSFEQVVFNADPSPPPFDAWLARAKQRGLRIAHVGDPAWVEMFGASIDQHRLDPKGVSIDVDFNPQTFRDARALQAENPDVLIVHFVTPDHQAHAHTVPSPRYAAHIRGFDRDLATWLGELEADRTVIVAGDHGAADSGTHGADVPIQRRTAVYAYGPGIAPGAHASAPIDQADLAGTFAALLGLPLPAHSRGHVLVDWLDVAPEQRRRIACADAERASRLARARSIDLPPPDCRDLGAARAHVARVDAAIAERTGLAAPVVVPLIAVVTLVGLLTVLAVLGKGALVASLAALALGALSVFLTWGIERLPGTSPLFVRVALFVLGNAIALAALVAPGKVRDWMQRAPNVAPAIVPGLLVATYTTNAQPEAYVALVVGLVLFVALGGLGRWPPTLVLRPVHVVLALLGAAVLFLPGTRTSDVYPDWLRRDGAPSMAVGSALLALAVAAMAARGREPRRWLVAGVGVALVLGAFLARRHVPAWPGRLAIVAGLAVAAAAALRGRRLHAIIAGLFTFSWISRDFEVVAVVATLLVADAAGAALARRETPLTLPQLLLATAFLFGVAFVQRIGLQGAIDFGSMDWGAAGFGDPHVPAWVIGSAMGLKYAIALALALGAFVSDLPRARAIDVVRAGFVAFLARGIVLTAMFLVCGASFWTGLRVLGDLPFGFLWATTAALLWLGLCWTGRRAPAREQATARSP